MTHRVIALGYGVLHKRWNSLSPTKLNPTLQVHTTKSYTQILCYTFCTICQKSIVHKYAGIKAVHKILVKLAHGEEAGPQREVVKKIWSPKAVLPRFYSIYFFPLAQYDQFDANATTKKRTTTTKKWDFSSY